MKGQEAVLFIPLGVYAFQQQLATALYLESQSEIRPHFLLISKSDHKFIRDLEVARLPYSTLDPVAGSGQVKVGVNSGDNRNLLDSGVQSLLKGLRWWRELWIRKRVAKRLARALAPRCAVVSQERLHRFLPILKALKELRIPVILMLASESSPDGPVAVRRESYLLKAGLKNTPPSPGSSPSPPLASNHIGGPVPGIAFLNRAVQRWLPSQVYDSRWGKMLFYPAAKIFLLKLMGMLPRNPWYQGTTFADYIMISGIDEEAMYAEARVDSRKLLFYGSHELDALHGRWLRRGEVRQKLIDEYHLDLSKSIMIVSLPRLWEQNIASEEVHWRSIKEILDVLTSHQDYNVIISLHPGSNRSHYAWIEEKYPIRICDEPLKDVLVAADIFVAAYSSTMRWAIALGIPVINIDLWGLNYESFKNLPGYQTVTTISELNELVGRVEADPNHIGLNNCLSPVSASIDSGQVLNGVLLDGKAKERLLHFIESLDGSTASSEVKYKHTEPVL